jgi:hypothetical protein
MQFGILAVVIIVAFALLPTPAVSSADVDAFERFCRTTWRAIVITLKLAALTVALVMAFYEFGGETVGPAIVWGIIGITGLRLFLWATEFVIPDNLHRFLSEKIDPGYLLKAIF